VTTILRTVPVMLPLALDGAYDYRVPEGMTVAPGEIVEVPLGPRSYPGVVWPRLPGETHREVDEGRLRPIAARYDIPPLPESARRFAHWVATYTVSPVGMVLRMMLGGAAEPQPEPQRIGVTLGGPAPGRMTPARTRALAAAETGHVWSRADLAREAGVSTAVVEGLVRCGALRLEPIRDHAPDAPDPDHAPPILSAEQAEAAARLRAAIGQGHSVALLDGVTGSGKTEVYFEAVAETLRQGRQALVMLPEIGLTQSFMARFAARFGARPHPWHSGVPMHQRARVWRDVAQGRAQIVLGARSALFLPYASLALIVVDEEHDAAFKQEDRVTYQARDMAVARAALEKIPVILSSATPSVESLVNAQSGRYTHIGLTQRHGAAELPRVETIDMRASPPPRGRFLSPPLVAAVGETLARGEQALLFLNRRGYAPITLCRSCGHRFECPHCAAWLVRHRLRRLLRCHHCGHSADEPDACPACGAEESLVACGPGVERIEEEAAALFPEARRIVLSSDHQPGVKALRLALDKIAHRDVDLVIGTQLIAKGHHFPGLALVGVVDADLSLANADPRAAERTFQLLSLVTGRGGRETIRGRGLLQTFMPDAPAIAALVAQDRDRFLAEEIEARRAAHLPPFGRLAGLIVSAARREDAEAHARSLARAAPPASRIRVLGPAEAPLAILRGRYRFRLLAKAAREADLGAYLRLWMAEAPKIRGSVRVDIDVDPYSFH
jgi:primosomal protein N' (replication factor Y)